MGYATATFTVLEQTVFGNKRINLVRVECTSYDTGGIQLSAANCGLLNLDYAIPFFVGSGSLGNIPVNVWWDKTNGLLMLYKATNSATDTATNMSGSSQYIYVIAIGA